MIVDRSSSSILGFFLRVIVVCFSEGKLDSFDISLVSVVKIKEGIVLFIDCFSEIEIDSFNTSLLSVVETNVHGKVTLLLKTIITRITFFAFAAIFSWFRIYFGEKSCGVSVSCYIVAT